MLSRKEEYLSKLVDSSEEAAACVADGWDYLGNLPDNKILLRKQK